MRTPGTVRTRWTPRSGRSLCLVRGLTTSPRQTSTPPDDARPTIPLRATLLPTMSLTLCQLLTVLLSVLLTSMLTVPLASARRNSRWSFMKQSRTRARGCPALRASESAQELSRLARSGHNGPHRHHTSFESEQIGFERARIGFG